MSPLRESRKHRRQPRPAPRGRGDRDSNRLASPGTSRRRAGERGFPRWSAPIQRRPGVHLRPPADDEPHLRPFSDVVASRWRQNSLQKTLFEPLERARPAGTKVPHDAHSTSSSAGSCPSPDQCFRRRRASGEKRLKLSAPGDFSDKLRPIAARMRHAARSTTTRRRIRCMKA